MNKENKAQQAFLFLVPCVCLLSSSFFPPFTRKRSRRRQDQHAAATNSNTQSRLPSRTEKTSVLLFIRPSVRPYGGSSVFFCCCFFVLFLSWFQPVLVFFINRRSPCFIRAPYLSACCLGRRTVPVRIEAQSSGAV